MPKNNNVLFKNVTYKEMHVSSKIKQILQYLLFVNIMLFTLMLGFIFFIAILGPVNSPSTAHILNKLLNRYLHAFSIEASIENADWQWQGAERELVLHLHNIRFSTKTTNLENKMTLIDRQPIQQEKDFILPKLKLAINFRAFYTSAKVLNVVIEDYDFHFQPNIGVTTPTSLNTQHFTSQSSDLAQLKRSILKCLVSHINFNLKNVNLRFSLPSFNSLLGIDKNEVNLKIIDIDIKKENVPGNNTLFPLVVLVKSNIEIDKKSSVLSAAIDFSKDDNLPIHLEVNELDGAILAHSQISYLENVSGNMSAKMDILVNNAMAIDKITFALSADQDKLLTAQLGYQNILIEKFLIEGLYEGPSDTLAIKKIDIRTKHRELSVVGAFQYIKSMNKFDGNINLTGDLSREEIYEYWPRNIAPNTKKWLEKHLIAGVLNEMKIDFKTVPIVHGKNSNSALHLSDSVVEINNIVEMQDVKIAYNFGVAALESPHLKIHAAPKNTLLTAQIGRLGAVELKDLNVLITTIDKTKSGVQIHTTANGDIKDLVDTGLAHVNRESLAQYSIDIPKFVPNKVTTALEAFVPFSDNTTTQHVAITTCNKVKNLQFADNFIQNVKTITSDKFEISIRALQLRMSGPVVINSKIPAILSYHKSLTKNDVPLERKESKIVLNAIVEPQWLKEFGIDIDGYVKDKIDLNVTIRDLSKYLEYMVKFDLANSTIDISPLEIHKLKSVEANAYFYLQQDKTSKITKIVDYEVNLPSLYSKGGGVLNVDGKLISLISSSNKFAEHKFGFIYKNQNHKLSLELNGEGIDLSSVNFGKILDIFKKNNGRIRQYEAIDITTNLQKIILKNGQTLVHPEFSLTCSHDFCKQIYFRGFFEERKGYVTIFYGHPVLAITSNNTGGLLKGIGLSSNIENGSLDVKLQFTKEGNVEGMLSMENFNMHNSPILSILFKIASISSSFAAMPGLLKGSGINFSGLECQLKYQKGNLLHLNKCYASGSTMFIKGNGIIDTLNDSAKFSGLIIPVHIINTIFMFVKKVSPRLGDFLLGIGGSKERVNFVVEKNKGGNIKISSNPLSIMIPGPFGQIFDSQSMQQAEVAELPAE
ncbi:hypothetical protein MIDIC_170020 [Alphaproteobacteria bacterium]